MRRMLAAILGVLGVLLVPSTAGAQDFYPPDGTGVLCVLNDLTPIPGQSITVECARAFAVGSQVTAFLGCPGDKESVLLGNIRTENLGSAKGSIVIPPDTAPGRHNIQIVGTDEAGKRVSACFPVSVLGETVRQPGLGGLPFTGSNNTRWMSAAFLLIGASAALKFADHRRRRQVSVVA